MRPKFKFCSIPSPYLNSMYINNWAKETNIPSTELIPPVCYREGAYWIRSISELNIKAFGVVYRKGKWYK